MYKLLIFINGGFLTIMFLLNRLLAQDLGIYKGALIFHLTGLFTIFIIAKFKKIVIFDKSKFHLYFILPGIFSLVMTILNNIAIPILGISIVTSISLFGQLISSIVSEKYGFLGVVKKEFIKEKLVGFGLLFIGVVIMAIY